MMDLYFPTAFFDQGFRSCVRKTDCRRLSPVGSLLSVSLLCLQWPCGFQMDEASDTTLWTDCVIMSASALAFLFGGWAFFNR